MAKKSKKKGDSIAGYFRQIFTEHPEWLEQKSNNEVLERYRADHNLSADDSVEKRVRDAMANTKSQMRKKLRVGVGSGRGGSRRGVRRGRKAAAVMTPPARLETLEENIDDCLTMARNLDRESLSNVIRLLRRARNEVVWKLGQPDK